MTADDRIAQLEAENKALKVRLDALEHRGKVARADPISMEKLQKDFNVTRLYSRYARDKLTWLTILLLFAETEYQTYPGANHIRIRFTQMSDNQYELYCETIDKLYDVLLDARNKSMSQNLNVWDLNSPNVPDSIVSTLEDSSYTYIHKGDTVPKTNNK